MTLFLQELAGDFPGEGCVVILDGAGWHRAGSVQIPESVKLIFLPPYSPELNPTEHVWSHLRTNVIGNTASDTLDDVVDTLCAGLLELSLKPDLVRSMTCYDWLIPLSLMYN